MKPLVSVIVPVWNATTYLDAALQSAWRQGVSNLQLIVIDDGSTDATAALMTSYGTAITAIYQSNLGPAAARNAGLRIATGDFITFLDADDEWANDCLNSQFQYLQANPNIGAVQGQIQYLRQIDQQWQLDDAPFFSMSLGASLFRCEVLAHVGLLDESLRYCEDVDWFFRAQQKQVTIQQHPDIVLYYRRHGQNLTTRRDLMERYMLRVLLKHKRSQKILL